MEKISVVLHVIEAEVEHLPRVLSSVSSLAAEIVLIDTTGQKEMAKIAAPYNAQIYKHDYVSYVEAARNFGISKAKNKWILLLDPDEELSGTLKEKIKKVIDRDEADYFRIPRKNIIFGKWVKHSRWWPDMNIRLFKKGHASWNEVIHAVPMTTGSGKDFEAKEENAIIHHHIESVEQYIDRMNRYTSVQAKNLLSGGYAFDWTDLIRKPMNEFLSRYFQGEGYKDGLHGLALALLQSFSELAVYLKAWQSEKYKADHAGLEEVVSEIKESVADLHYWESDALLKEVGGLKHRIKRKLKL